MDTTLDLSSLSQWFEQAAHQWRLEAIAMVRKQPGTIPGAVVLAVWRTEVAENRWGIKAQVIVVSTERKPWFFADTREFRSFEEANIEFRRTCARFWVGMPANTRPCCDLAWTDHAKDIPRDD